MASAKVYLRNFGKGVLELSDKALELYVETGRFSKKKELAKEILFADVEDVNLDVRELTVAWKGATDRFVFEDSASAQVAFSKISPFAKQRVRSEDSEQPGEPSIAVYAVQDESKEVSVDASESPEGIASEIGASEASESPKNVENKSIGAAEVSVDEPKTAIEVVPEAANPEPPAKMSECPVVAEEPNPESEAPSEVAQVEQPVEVNVIKEEPVAVSVGPKESAEIRVDEEREEVHVFADLVPEAAVVNVVGHEVVAALSLVDSVFDVLRSLQGRVDWVRMSNCLERSEKDAESLVNSGLVEIHLDFGLLSSAIGLHNIEFISSESYRLLHMLSQAFQDLDSAARSVIQSYYLLNDLILASAVGDENVDEEISILSTLLTNLANESGLSLKVDEMLASAKKLSFETGNELLVKEVRSLFLCQLSLAVTN